MIAFTRLAVFGFLGLAVLYLLISVYSRSLRREKLENEWDDLNRVGDRDAFIREGMAEYEGSLRKKLIVLVFIIPIILFLVIQYVINFG